MTEASLGEGDCELDSEGWIEFGHPEMAEGILGQRNSLSKGAKAGVGGTHTRNGEQCNRPDRLQTGTHGPHPSLRHVLSGPPALASTASLKKVQSIARARR